MLDDLSGVLGAPGVKELLAAMSEADEVSITVQALVGPRPDLEDHALQAQSALRALRDSAGHDDVALTVAYTDHTVVLGLNLPAATVRFLAMLAAVQAEDPFGNLDDPTDEELIGDPPSHEKPLGGA